MKSPTVFSNAIRHAFFQGAVAVLVAFAASVDEHLAGLSTWLKVEHLESGAAWPSISRHNTGGCAAHTVFTDAIHIMQFHSLN